MAVTTPRHRQSQLVPGSRPVHQMRRRQRQKSGPSLMSRAYGLIRGLAASLAGGIGLQTLLYIALIPPPDNLPIGSLSILMIPAILVVCLATGLLAGISAEDNVKNCLRGGMAGWTAGFWAGIFNGIGAMYLAAGGVLMVSFGQNVVTQFTPEQLEALKAFGLASDSVALAGRVSGALIVYGILGSLIAALFSSIGGFVYPMLNQYSDLKQQNDDTRLGTGYPRPPTSRAWQGE